MLKCGLKYKSEIKRGRVLFEGGVGDFEKSI